MTRNPWIPILASGSVAATAGAAGILLTPAPGALTGARAALLAASLAAGAAAFALLARRVVRLELEREGLVEEVSQELDRVRTRLARADEGLAAREAESGERGAEGAATRRLAVK